MNYSNLSPEQLELLEVNVDQADAALNEKSHVILDVREQQEWNDAHIEGATHIPLGELQARAGELPEGTPIYTICHSGVRSLYAIEMLDQAGHEGAKSIAGGMVAWAGAGKPMVR